MDFTDRCGGREFNHGSGDGVHGVQTSHGIRVSDLGMQIAKSRIQNNN